MNEHDSQRMEAMAASLGYAPTELLEEASLILVNTCSVRANPENKVYSYLGTLRSLKIANPDLIVGVGGCVAQQAGEILLQKAPVVDFVFGPDNLFRLPELIESAQKGERTCVTTWQNRTDRIQEFIPEVWIDRSPVEGIRGYIAITKGCNNYCSFCIVPKVRGREISRPPESILREARTMLDKGAREIWLLGQNVNSYRAGDFGFYELLDTVSRLEDLCRLRFTSPHPKDWNEHLSNLMAERPTICKHLHLPFQAGSNAILKAMRRRHTIEEYLDKVAYLRSVAPTVDISTDLIVGFPGETEKDFEQTLEVMATVRFSQVFPFKYSVRPGTAAANFPDDVPRQEKEERLSRVIALQERINEEEQQRLVGTQQTVLLESYHPREDEWMNGRTEGYRAISVKTTRHRPGDLVNANVVGSRGHWLYAEIAEDPI